MLIGIGVLLLAFSAHMFWARTRRIHHLEALHFVISDLLWLVATAVLFVAAPETLSATGRAAALGVAVAVGFLAFEQRRGIVEAATGPVPTPSSPC